MGLFWFIDGHQLYPRSMLLGVLLEHTDNNAGQCTACQGQSYNVNGSHFSLLAYWTNQLTQHLEWTVVPFKRFVLSSPEGIVCDQAVLPLRSAQRRCI